MKKLFLLLFMLLFSAMLIGCSSSDAENVKEILDEELIVNHWPDLPDERKLSLIQEVQSEGRYTERHTEEVKEYLIMLFDAGMRNTPHQKNNLMKAMKEFNDDRVITENSK
ncbi:hypothetical protein [Bacillus sp. SG-1]|uniref:hypothetical protein n=1 Tax=Bacillus sp. SG-1 TaxID=161544 RepID=UPI000302E0FC|nr:hypothetical protein [Bacillus sp. SG-1]